MPYPMSITKLAETIGWDAALKLIEFYPGVRLYVPAKLKDNHPLIVQLGKECATKLVTLCQKEEIWIPTAKSKLIAERNANIVNEYNAGTKVPDLARKYNLTDRHIYSILSTPQHEDLTSSQLTIF